MQGRPPAVDRCVCHHVPFTLVKDLHAKGLSLPQIVDQTQCGTGCGLCEPYLRLVCLTGYTRLPIMSPTRIEAAVRQLEAEQRASAPAPQHARASAHQA